MSAPRRPRGSGALFPLGDGRWQAQRTVWLPAADGTPVRKRLSATLPSREAGEAWLAQTAQAQAGARSDRAFVAAQETIGAYLLRWYAARQGVVKPATWRRDRWALGRIVPALGALPVGQLEWADVRRFYGAETKAGLSPASVRILRHVLAGAYQQLVEDRVLPHNPLRDVRPPRLKKAVHRPLEPDEVRRLLAVARTPPQRPPKRGRTRRSGRLWPALTIALYCGLRPGELLGLQLGDWDQAHGTLYVQRQLDAIERETRAPIYGTPKTEAGVRRFDVEPRGELAEALAAAVAIVDEDRRRRGARYRDWGLLFATRWGTPLDEHNLVRAWKEALGWAGLPRTIRLYDGRHSTATNLAAQGVDAATIAQIMGHADPGFSYSRYVKPLRGSQREAMQRLGRAFGPPDQAPAPPIDDAQGRSAQGASAGATRPRRRPVQQGARQR